MMHLISARQFKTTKQLDHFFTVVDDVERNISHVKSNIMASLFYEPSTRTRFSFEAAMHKLGGKVISEANSSNLSATKGESLEDTVRTVSQYVDVIVLRHPDNGAAERAVHVSQVPIINAGDGTGEHPTQALLDIYTIHQKFKLDGLTILMCGDLKNGRTVHSLATLLSLYSGVRIITCNPDLLFLPSDLVAYLETKNVSITHCKTLEDGLTKKPNIVYMTRLQKERWKSSGDWECVCQWNDYCLTPKLMRYLDDDAIVMHPLPRNEELAVAIDDDPRCVYFTNQVRNGMKVRMGLLYSLFQGRVCYDWHYDK